MWAQIEVLDAPVSSESNQLITRRSSEINPVILLLWEGTLEFAALGSGTFS